jgi:hypothetical protein
MMLCGFKRSHYNDRAGGRAMPAQAHGTHRRDEAAGAGCARTRRARPDGGDEAVRRAGTQTRPDAGTVLEFNRMTAVTHGTAGLRREGRETARTDTREGRRVAVLRGRMRVLIHNVELA